MNNESNQSHKAIIAIIGVIAAVVLIIITISILAINFAPREEANIVNSQSLSSNNSDANENFDQQISDSELTRFKQELYNLLNSTQSADHDFDAAIRWDTVQAHYGSYPYTTFLVDIDEYEQTYRVNIYQNAVELPCPKLGESKYPESFCIGNAGEYDDSINVVFGNNLPYSGETSAGEYFSISRNDIESMENASDRYLRVLIRSCPWSDDALERAREAVNQYIESRGASSNLFDIRIEPAGGCHGE